MNKKLIALAVAAAVAPAAAMATESSVTIYGQANASYDRISTGTAGADTLARISSNSSRLGFKGTEDLGDGLSTVWQIESSVELDAGGGTLAGRNSFVGIKGNSFGTVLLGRHDTPYKMGSGKLDVFSDTMGDANSIMGSVDGDTAFDNRAPNVLAYISPTVNNIHGAIATVTANEAGNGAAANGKAYSLTGIYSGGPLFASLSWEKYTSTNAGNLAVNADESASAVKIAVGFNDGPISVGAIYEKISSSEKDVGKARNAIFLSAAYKVASNTTVKAQYAKAGDSDNPATDTGAKHATIGVEQTLSKRTSVYALYTKLVNKDGSYDLGPGAGGKYSTATGEDPKALSLGIKHKF